MPESEAERRQRQAERPSLWERGLTSCWSPAVIRMHPPIARRAHRCIYLGIVTLLASVLLKAVLEVLLPNGRESIGLLLLSLSTIGFGIALLIGGLLAVGSLIRRVRSGNHLICGHCGHDVSGSRAKGECSECGARFVDGHLRGFWMRYLTFNMPFGGGKPPPKYLVYRAIRAVIIITGVLLLAALAIVRAAGDANLPAYWGFLLFFVMVLALKLIGDLIVRQACRQMLCTGSARCLECRGLLGECGDRSVCQSCGACLSRTTGQSGCEGICPPCWDLEWALERGASERSEEVGSARHDSPRRSRANA